MASVKLLYFAWVREKVGHGDDTFELPEAVASVTDLIQWLRLQGPEYDAAFENKSAIRVAINQEHVTHDALLAGAKEIAFFPPVTGG
ncbi:MAG: molybdopterin converting factor subunit 1 [Pseudomonadota bacterium]